MIPRPTIAAWASDHPWPTFDQVEQDLLLSQAICAIANDEPLGDELALRGGTAFHKMFLPEPYRYSEDLDYVRSTSGGIGDVMHRLTDLGNTLGYQVRTQMGKYPKVYWRYEAESGARSKIKIEIDTFERSPMLGFSYVNHSPTSPFVTASARVRSFYPAELVATKLRALYQRSKGRDLFDLWLALTVLRMDPTAILAAFPAYRPEDVRASDYIANLTAKLGDKQFLADVSKLVRSDAPAYDPREAGDLVVQELISKL